MDCHKDCHEIFNESFNELSTTDWRYTVPIANHEQHQHKIYLYLWAYVCMQRGSKCEHSQGHRHMWVRTTWVHILYINVFLLWYMYTCDYMHVNREVLSVSTRKGTDICEFAQHGVIHKSICNMKYVYLWIYVCIQRGSKCEHSQGHRHMWVRTTRSHIQKYL